MSAMDVFIFSLEVEASTLGHDACDGYGNDLECIVADMHVLLESQTPFRRELQRSVEWCLRHECPRGDAASLASALTRRGYRVSMRSSLGGGQGSECFRNLQHTFLSVLPPSASKSAAPLVVDPCFREQFAIAHPTPRYEALCRAIPAALAIEARALGALVPRLAREMEEAFRATGAATPPWRRARAMLSKWLPEPDRVVQCAVETWGEEGEGNHACLPASPPVPPFTELAPAPVFERQPMDELDAPAAGCSGAFSCSSAQDSREMSGADGAEGPARPGSAAGASPRAVLPGGNAGAEEGKGGLRAPATAPAAAPWLVGGAEGLWEVWRRWEQPRVVCVKPAYRRA